MFIIECGLLNNNVQISSQVHFQILISISKRWFQSWRFHDFGVMKRFRIAGSHQPATSELEGELQSGLKLPLSPWKFSWLALELEYNSNYWSADLANMYTVNHRISEILRPDQRNLEFCKMFHTFTFKGKFMTGDTRLRYTILWI